MKLNKVASLSTDDCERISIPSAQATIAKLNKTKKKNSKATKDVSKSSNKSNKITSFIHLLDAVSTTKKKNIATRTRHEEMKPPPPPSMQKKSKKKSNKSPSDDVDDKQGSISNRRNRGITSFLFEEIVGKKLKCYERWRLWLCLFVCMTVIAAVAIVFATVFAVKYTHEFNSKTEAAEAEHNLMNLLINDLTANFTDHIDEVQKIFNTFDDDNDGLWDIDEFANHFVLASGTKATFDDIDLDGDDILSYHEVASSIMRYETVHSYVALIKERYNYTYWDTTDINASYSTYKPAQDPLLNQYAANIYFDMYGVGTFGYITREYFYRFHSRSFFDTFDTNHDGSLDFDEFTYETGDDNKIEYLRRYNFDYVISRTLERLNGSDNKAYNPTSSENNPYNMCPSSDVNTRRRLVPGTITYLQVFGNCTNELTCDSSLCDQTQIDLLVGCMSGTIRSLNNGTLNYGQCKAAMTNCIDTYFVDSCFVGCTCHCNGDCTPSSGYNHGCNYFCPEERDEFRRRLGPANCDCGCGGCQGNTCFDGDNMMLIKREDVIQNVLLKDMRINDYVQTETGEWSKVWYIKYKEGMYSYLNLYFDEDEYVTITGDHLVYIDDDVMMKRADEVSIGDIVFIMDNSSLVIKKEVIYIDNVVLSDGAYSPVTMDGSIVVSKVVSSCYAQSPLMAEQLHDVAAIFRWISTYNANAAIVITDFFYELMFMKLRNNYGLDVALLIFTGYSTPFIVVTTAAISFFLFFRVFSYFV